MTDQYVLWGYRPDYVDQSIKLNGGRTAKSLSSLERARRKEGFLTAIYKAGTSPNGLIVQVAEVRSAPAEKRGGLLYKLGVEVHGRVCANAWGLPQRSNP